MAWYVVGEVTVAPPQSLYDAIVAAYKAMPITTVGIPNPVPNFVTCIQFTTATITLLDPVGVEVVFPISELCGCCRNTIDMQTIRMDGTFGVMFEVI